MTAGGILALDLSTRTGWCQGGLDDAEPVSGVWVLPPMSQLAACFVALENELDDLIELRKPRLVLSEAPIEKQQTSARLLIGLANQVLATCYRHGILAREQSVNTMRLAMLGTCSFAARDPRTGRRVPGTGSQNAKAAVIAWCHAQGWTQIADHNEADARLAWAYARREMVRRRAARAQP